MQVVVDTINAFTKNGEGGNPAGVVVRLGEDLFSSKHMQGIATTVNLSETAFVFRFNRKKSSADFGIRFFTINTEVGLCGHATIAAWTDLLQKKIIKPGSYIQKLKAGTLQVDVLIDGRIVMDQLLPNFKNKLPTLEIAKVLNIPQEWINNTALTPQVVSTGLNDLMVPIDTREHLFAIQLNDTRISDFEEKNGLDSFHIFTLDTIEQSSTANSRNADPLHGIHEESATGSAHGALACYLYQWGIITTEQSMKGLTFEQGYNMKSPSEIFVRLEIQNKKIHRVQVGGLATFKGKQNIEI